MPPLPPVQNVLKSITSWTMGPVNCVNIFHIHYGGNTPSVANAQAIAQQVHSAYTQAFTTLVLPTVQILQTEVIDLTSAYGSQGTYVQHISGTAAGPVLPNSAAIVGSWGISQRYRGGKPRTYICGMPETDLADSRTWSASTVTSFQNAFQGFMNSVNNMIAAVGVGPYQLGCVHYRRNLQPLPTPTFDPFTSVNVSNLVRSQRGRLS